MQSWKTVFRGWLQSQTQRTQVGKAGDGNCEEERKQAESQKRQWQKWALGACQQGPATKDVSNSIPIHAFYTESDSLHLSQLRFTYLDTLYMYVTFCISNSEIKGCLKHTGYNGNRMIFFGLLSVFQDCIIRISNHYLWSVFSQGNYHLLREQSTH